MSRRAVAKAPSPPATIRPGLLLVLLAVGGAAVWLALNSDADAPSAPGRKGAATQVAARGAKGGHEASELTADPAARPAPSTGSASADASHAAQAEWLERLAQANTQWVQRASFEPLSKRGRIAWTANLPPPPPARPLAPPPPPPQPVAPIFPYQMVGRWEEPARPVAASAAASQLGGQRGAAASAAASGPAGAASGPAGEATSTALAVITGPQTTWVVKTGDVIEGQWRVDAVSARAVNLTYLPLQESQTVSMKQP